MNRRVSQSLSLRTVLIATSILPLVASLVFGAIWARACSEAAAHAQTVSGQITVLSILSQLQFGVETDRLFHDLDSKLQQPGVLSVRPDEASTAARLWRNGHDLLANPAALNSLSNGTGAARLDRVLRGHESATHDPGGASTDDLTQSATAIRALIADVRRHADPDVLTRTAVFDQFSDLQALMVSEARTFVGVLTGSHPSPETAISLFRTAAREDALVDVIVGSIGPTLGDRLREGLAGEDMAVVRRAIADEAGLGAGPPVVATLTPERLERVRNRYMTLPEVRGELADVITAEANEEVRQADMWVGTAAIVVLVLTAVTLISTGLISRLVIRRLTMLADAASRIGDGDIDDKPLPADGPREIADVTIAFNRMSDLLLTLDRQVSALGAARLHDPALHKSLPGRIGSEIQQSVQLIAGTTQRLQAAQELAAAIIDAAVDAIITVDDLGIIRSANPAAAALTGLPTGELDTQPIGRVLTNLPPFDQLVESHDSVAITLERRHGDPVAALVSAREIQGSDGSPARAFFIRDISERAAWEERFRYQATHDELTGLPNRFAISEHLETLEAHDDGCPVAVLCVDLDRFKYVNDAHGHHNGDQVIGIVAERLLAVVPTQALVARIGGDEFAVVVRPGEHDDPEWLAARISQRLAAPIEIDNERLSLQSCVGISVASHAAAGTEDLLRFAEVALTTAKQNGTGSISVYDETMSEQVERRTRLEQRLRQALTNDELEMFAQPIVDLASQRIAGVELLARWQHDGEWIPPDVFIPIAEESGLIQAVGRWAMGCACRLLEEFHAAGLTQTVSVNISGLHLISGEVASELAGLLRGTSFDRSRLRVELTESFLLADPVLAATRLNEIRELGADIVIDDFGTGYSSLTYLHALPIDGLKLDRSFVSRLGGNEGDDTIVRLVNDLATGLHLDLVAEGVETEAQRDMLLGHGYAKGQGYLWSRPVSLADLWDLLRRDDLAPARQLSPARR